MKEKTKKTLGSKKVKFLRFLGKSSYGCVSHLALLILSIHSSEDSEFEKEIFRYCVSLLLACESTQ